MNDDKHLAPHAAMSEDPPPCSRGGEEGEGDPRITQALEEYLAALESGQTPDRAQLQARYPDIADSLSEHLEGLEFLHRTVAEMHDSTFGGTAAKKAKDRTAGGAAIAAPALADYQIVREIGRGGMGIVYEAVQRSLQRRVALKVLPLGATLDPRQLQRFKNESQAAAQLQHPNIVPVFAVGCEQGAHYYAMQFIEGKTLSEHIHDLQSASGNLKSEIFNLQSSQRVAWIGVQAAEALEHAHQMGVVHRDVKPSNLLLDTQGQLWITDFGLARWSADGALTTTGDLLGTLRYMSPEQAAGRRGLVDHRADVYSLGATLYELVTLQPVFGGSDHGELLQQILNDEPTPPRRLCPQVPRDLETILLKSLAKRVEDRYATAQDMADDLRRFVEGRPILARRPSLWERAGHWARRHRRVVASAAALLLLAVVGLIAGTVLIGQEQAKTRAAQLKAEAAYQQQVEARAKEDEARKKEAREWARAEENHRQALQVLDYLTEIAAVDMATESDLTKVRRKVLQAALSYYEDFIKQQDDANLLTREELLRGYARVATILDAIGRPKEAQAAWKQVFKLGMCVEDGFQLTPLNSKLRLLRVAAVQQDLKLNAGQGQAIQELEARLRNANRPRRPGEPAAREQAEVIEKEAAALLNPGQAKRLGQLLLQQRGVWAFQDATVSASLELTPGQREALAAIQRQAQASRRFPGAVGDPGKKSSMDRILVLLTAEQKSRWHDLVGEPFRGVLPAGEMVLSLGTISIQIVPAARDATIP